jgi:hypothetical protein
MRKLYNVIRTHREGFSHDSPFEVAADALRRESRTAAEPADKEMQEMKPRRKHAFNARAPPPPHERKVIEDGDGNRSTGASLATPHGCDSLEFRDWRGSVLGGRPDLAQASSSSGQMG